MKLFRKLLLGLTLFMACGISLPSTARAALGDAVDAPGLTWTTGGDSSWFEQTGTYYSNGSSAQSGPILDDQSSYIETTLTGPVLFTFRWKVQSESNHDFLIFYIDGVEMARVSYRVNWAQQTYAIPSGSHTLRWEYVKDSAGSYGSDAAWLDAFTVAPTHPLADAVDDTLFVWSTGGDESWFGTEMSGRVNNNEARSGVIADGQSTYIQTDVTGPGYLAFDWRTSSEADSDFLTVTVDGASRGGISGVSSEWRGVIVPAGTHTVRWEYARDASGSGNGDFASLDNVTFASTIPLADALDNAALTFTSGGNSQWIGRTAAAGYDGDDAQCSPLQDGESSWIETTVTGPGHLSYNIGVSGELGQDVLSFTIDGTVADIFTSVDDLYAEGGPYGYPIPAGAHTLRWTYQKDIAGQGGQDTAWLDRVFFVPAVDLAEAVDNLAMTFTTGGDAEWAGQDLVSYQGGDAAQSGTIGDNESSWIETTVSGPAFLDFRWKPSTLEDDDFGTVYRNGAVVGQVSGSYYSWYSKRLSLSPGSNTIRWEYSKNGASETGNDALYLDKVELTPITGISLGEALDNTTLTWTTGGDADWIGQDAITRNGDAAESGTIGDEQSTWLETTVTGPGLLSFYARVYAEANHDFLELYRDGVLMQQASTGNWLIVPAVIPAGDHTVRWVYRKDASGSHSTDHAWLDEVSLSPFLDLGEAVDNTSLTWSTGGDADWAGQDAVSGTGGDAAVSGWIAPGESSWIGTTVTGPGIITFSWAAQYDNTVDALTFSDNGAVREERSASSFVSLADQQYIVPPGSHDLRWEYSRSALGNGIAKAGFLDNVAYTPAVPLETALENSDLAWVTGGDSEWAGIPGGTGEVVQNGWIDDGQSSWIETTVTGPGQISYRFKASSERDRDYFSVYLDGQLKRQWSGYASGFSQMTHIIPPGDHTIRWEYAKDASGSGYDDQAQIDWVSYVPAIPIATALDSTGLSWTTGGDADWAGQTGTTYRNGSAAQSGWIGDGQSSWLETTVTGPGRFSFWWSVSSQRNADYLSLYIDGVLDSQIQGSLGWNRREVTVPAGAHTLRWAYEKDGSVTDSADCGFLDWAHYEPTVSLAEAVDNADLVWTTGGYADPYGQTVVFEHDGDAARSGWVGSYESWMETTVEGPGYLSFSWKISAGTGYQKGFFFHLDGAPQPLFSIGGEVDWRREWVSIPAGTHTLRWRYDGVNELIGENAGWLDRVEYMPPISLQEALDNPALTWASSAPFEWFGEDQDFVHGGSAAQSADVQRYFPVPDSWIETTVVGPKIVSFDWKLTGGYQKILQIDGSVKSAITPSSDWVRTYTTIPSGNHTLRWEIDYRNISPDYYDRGYLDQVVTTDPVPLGEALDSDYLSWTTGSGREWLGQRETFSHGGSAAQSTAIGDGDSSHMETTVHGPGTLSFLWKVSSEAGDTLDFSIDGAAQDSIAGTVDWTERTYDIPEGPHTLRWEYSKDAAATEGEDSGWVDRVSYLSDVVSTVCDAGCDYDSIQDAIADAVPLQEILVKDGTYTGAVDFLGKDIALVSENGPEYTVIDAAGGGSAVLFVNGEGPWSILDGFRITGGAGNTADGSSGDDPGTYGGGVYGEIASPTIRNCIVDGNVAADRGGGVYFYSSSPKISNTVVSGNSSENGGGLYFTLSDAELINLRVSGNTAASSGGGLFLSDSDALVMNGTVASNSSSVSGGGVVSLGSSPDLVNTILWGNEAGGLADQLWESSPGSSTVAYSDIEGGDPGAPGQPWPGTGNIDSDPLFVDPRPASAAPTAAGNYCLKPPSPCIDSGTEDSGTYSALPPDDGAGQYRPQGVGYDRGADEHVFRGDWDADGSADLFWRNMATGVNFLWYMDGPFLMDGAYLPTINDTTWAVRSTMDFNGDGMPDLLWRSLSFGMNYIWYMSGTEYLGGEMAGYAWTDWLLAEVADFNLDNHPDILWRRPSTGENYIWYMKGADLSSVAALPSAGTAWTVAAADDFNGDGRPDVLWRNEASGDNYLWYLDGHSVVGGEPVQPASADWAVDGTADFNGDGKPDICWRNYSTGVNYIWYMDGSTPFGGELLNPVGDTDWHIEQ